MSRVHRRGNLPGNAPVRRSHHARQVTFKVRGWQAWPGREQRAMNSMGISMFNSMGAAALAVAFFVSLYGTAASLGGAITGRRNLIRSSMYSVCCMDFKLCSYTLTPGILPLYKQQGDAPPFTSTSKWFHGNGHMFESIYLSTTLTPFCFLLIFS